jgi:glycosyltransferase involved in cell wall biosynthesis
MVIKGEISVFIVWKEYQRRVEVLAPYLDLEIFYFHYSWEEKSRIFKALSYFLKSIETLRCLIQKKPPLVFIQFPPTPLLYCVALYSWLIGCRYMADCHIWTVNVHWLKWICTKKLLRGKIIVHNDVIEQVIRSLNLKPLVVRDAIAKKPLIQVGDNTLLQDLSLSPKCYLIIPCSFSSDEPIQEIIEAARLLPDIMFVMTWYCEKLSSKIRNILPSNVLLTGYLQIGDFNQLFSNAGVALVLTKQENVQLSGMQEAMAFEIPAVVSDLKTTRFLYKEYPVYVKNDPDSIANGVKYAFQNKLDLEKKMKSLRAETEKESLNQLENLKSSLNLLS